MIYSKNFRNRQQGIKSRVIFILIAIVLILPVFYGKNIKAYSQKRTEIEVESKVPVEGVITQIDLLAGTIIIRQKDSFDTIQVDSSTTILKEINLRELEVNRYLKIDCTKHNGVMLAEEVKLTHLPDSSE